MILAKEGIKVVWDRNKFLLVYIAIITTVNLLAVLHYVFIQR